MRLFLKLSLVAVVASLIYVKGMKEMALSNTFMLQSNIEALAFDEWKGDIYCIAEGNVDCPIGYPKVEYVIELENFK